MCGASLAPAWRPPLCHRRHGLSCPPRQPPAALHCVPCLFVRCCSPSRPKSRDPTSQPCHLTHYRQPWSIEQFEPGMAGGSSSSSSSKMRSQAAARSLEAGVEAVHQELLLRPPNSSQARLCPLHGVVTSQLVMAAAAARRVASSAASAHCLLACPPACLPACLPPPCD